MRSILTLAIKDLRLLVRDRFGLFWVIAFPLLMALFFGAIFSGGSDTRKAMKVAFVGDGSPSAEAFHEKFEQADVLSVQELPLDSARSLVSQGKLIAYVKFSDTSNGQAGMFSGVKPIIEVGIDPSRRAEAGYLQGLVNQAYFASMQESMMSPDKMRTSISQSKEQLKEATGLNNDQRRTYLNFLNSLDTFMAVLGSDTINDSANSANSASTADEENYNPFGQPDITYVDLAVERVGPRSSWEITFPQCLQWALIGCASAFGVSIVVERTRGTLTRLRLAPVSRAQILAGKGLACFLACAVVVGGLIAFGILVFNVGYTSLLHLALAVIASAICFVGIMMFISVLGKTEQAVAGAGWAIMLVMAMTGGAMVPLFYMPSWLRIVSNFSPVKWSVLALEGAVWRGFTIQQMLEPVGMLTGIGVVGFAVGAFILSRTDR